jgi:hypothetical protein
MEIGTWRAGLLAHLTTNRSRHALSIDQTDWTRTRFCQDWPRPRLREVGLVLH